MAFKRRKVRRRYGPRRKRRFTRRLRPGLRKRRRFSGRRKKTSWARSRKVIPTPEVKWADFKFNDVAPAIGMWPSGYNTETCWPLTLDSGGVMNSDYAWKHWNTGGVPDAGVNSHLLQGHEGKGNFIGSEIYVKMYWLTFKMSSEMVNNIIQTATPIVIRLWKDERPGMGTTLWQGDNYYQTLTGRRPSPIAIYVDPNVPNGLRKMEPDIDTQDKKDKTLGWKCLKTWVIRANSAKQINADQYFPCSQDNSITIKLRMGRVKFDTKDTDQTNTAVFQKNKRYFLTFNWKRGNNANNGSVGMAYNGYGRVYYTDS